MGIPGRGRRPDRDGSGTACRKEWRELNAFSLR
jgi:hypothetical protein